MKSALTLVASALLLGQYAPPPSGPASGPALEQSPPTGEFGGSAAPTVDGPAVSEPLPVPAPGAPASEAGDSAQDAEEGTGGAGVAEGGSPAAPGEAPEGRAGDAAAPSAGPGTLAEDGQAGAAAKGPTPQELEQQQLEALQQGFGGMQQQLQQLSEIAAANAQEAAQLRAELDALAARGEQVAVNRQQRISALAGVNRNIEQAGNALTYGASDVVGQLEATRQSLEGVIGNANSFGGGGGERNQAFEALRYVQAAQERVDNGDLFTARQYLIIASELTGQAIGSSDVSTASEFQPTVGGGP